MSKDNKADLIFAIQNLLQANNMQTQEDIRMALKKQGLNVNQVMISRVLHKLGAIKMSTGDQIVYRLPTELVAVTPDHSVKHLILKITHNETLILIHTIPGSAQLVARLLDQKSALGILGTVAGDDTIFVAPEKTKLTKLVFQQIYNHLLK